MVSLFHNATFGPKIVIFIRPTVPQLVVGSHFAQRSAVKLADGLQKSGACWLVAITALRILRQHVRCGGLPFHRCASRRRQFLLIYAAQVWPRSERRCWKEDEIGSESCKFEQISQQTTNLKLWSDLNNYIWCRPVWWAPRVCCRSGWRSRSHITRQPPWCLRKLLLQSQPQATSVHCLFGLNFAALASTVCALVSIRKHWNKRKRNQNELCKIKLREVFGLWVLGN